MAGLHLNNVSHAFGSNDVLKGVSVFVAPGELVCLLGPSGCGKTTLLRIAAGLEELQVGQVTIDDAVVAEGRGGKQLPPERRGVGLMFQDFALFPHLSVFENIAYGLQKGDRARREWAREALAAMDLAGYAEAYPHILSGGQQQRVALLRALAPNPRVLLLDEPFSGLDVTRRAAVREDTLGLIKETDVATLMVTHDPEEAMFMADRILVMNEGRIIQDGTPVEVYFEPSNPFVAALFGPVNRLEGRVAAGRVETPLGSFAADGLADGALAQVLIHPEGLRLARPGGAPDPQAGDAGREASNPPADGGGDGGSPAARLTVLSARPLGRSSHLFLELSANGRKQRIEARVPGVFLPTSGEPVDVSVNARQAHVFPLD